MRPKVNLATAVEIAIAVIMIASCSQQHGTTVAMPQFRELSDQDKSRLDAQRAVVTTAVRERYGISALTQTAADLPALQRLIDDRAFNKRRPMSSRALASRLVMCYRVSFRCDG